MKKKIIAAALLLAGTALFGGCGAMKNDTGERIYEKIQSVLLSMQTYEATGSVRYISNKNDHEYKVKQSCKITGEYRIEVTGPERVAGNITVFDGTTICQYNERIAGRYSIAAMEAAERLELFVTSFVKNYLKANNVSVSASSIDAGGGAKADCTILEADILGEHPYLRSEKLWVDNKSLKPVKLVIYDAEGNERIVVTFETFEYNVKLDDSIFVIQQRTE